jgi:hypothetical protein
MPTALEIKGIGDGLLVHVPTGSWTEARPALLQAIDERADFFRGARLVLQLTDLELGRPSWASCPMPWRSGDRAERRPKHLQVTAAGQTWASGCNRPNRNQISGRAGAHRLDLIGEGPC